MRDRQGKQRRAAGSNDRAHDEARTRFLASQGYLVLRFWNNEVTENLVSWF
jgi:very-short-patch-repair endonuclease